MKNIFKAIVETFNNKYVKALYITIFILILILCFLLLLISFPTILGMGIVFFIFLSIYLIVLDIFN